MNICGVIAEYNPFHNGHRHQLREARRMSGCDYLIVCMGGAFSQRGETMLLDKWTRTRMALDHGADMVVELPALFAVRSADMFAAAGVQILAGLGANALSFGCETDDLPLLNRMLDALDTEDEALRAGIRARLDEGKSHVRARGEAVAEQLNLPTDALSQPNTALALEYLRANRKLRRPMEIHVVHRAQGYHDPSIHEFSSASAIRAAVYEGQLSAVCESMPQTAYESLLTACPARVCDMSRLDALLIDRLRLLGPEGVAALPDVSEGLEMRVAKCAEETGSRAALLNALKCKRYTHARLSRLCAHALLGMTKQLTARRPAPEYARLLGFRQEAKALLTYVSRQSLPLITRPSLLKEDEIFSIERRATDLQALCFMDEAACCAGRDLTERMIVR